MLWQNLTEKNAKKILYIFEIMQQFDISPALIYGRTKKRKNVIRMYY